MFLYPNERHYFRLDEAASRLNVTVGDLLHFAKTGTLQLCCYLTKRDLKNRVVTIPDNCINQIGLKDILDNHKSEKPPSSMLIHAREKEEYGAIVMDLETKKVVDVDALLAIPTRFIANIKKGKNVYFSAEWLSLPKCHKKPELTEFGWVIGGGRSLQFHFDEPFDIYLDEIFITKEQLEATEEYLNVANKPETIHEKRQRLIIQHLKEMRIDPLNFPFKNGARTPKSDLKAKLVNLHPKLFTESTFDKAWEVLRELGQIKDEK